MREDVLMQDDPVNKAAADDVVLSIRDLHTHVMGSRGTATALNGVSLEVHRDEIVGLIGETGAGKSLTAWSLIQLLESGLEVVRGSAHFDDENLIGMPERRLRRIRGGRIGVIVQNPRGSLDPMQTIGRQLVRMHRRHSDVSARDARRRAVEMLGAVGIPDPDSRMKSYSHELSGGMAQRVLIAMAMINEPDLLIADEPTTGLDVTVQAQILDLMRDRVRRARSAALLITHDLGVVAHYCDRVAVMFAGRIVEEAPVAELFANPRHPYTRALIASTPDRAEDTGAFLDEGQPPDLFDLPPGCHYAYRCPMAAAVCREPVPNPVVGPEHHALCHFPEGH